MSQIRFPTTDTGSGLLVPAYAEISQQSAAPAPPATGKTRLYLDANGLLQLLPAGTAPARRVIAHFGSGTAWPTGMAAGDTFLRTDVGTGGTLFTYAGAGGLGGWIPESGPVVCTSTTRPAAALCYAGLTIYETDTGRTYVWNANLAAGAGAWDQLGGPPEQYSITFAAGFATFGSGAAGSWQPALILKRGRECWLIGNIQAAASGGQTTLAAGTTYTVGTLPSAVQPLTNEQAVSTVYQAPGQASWNVLVNSTSPYNLQIVPIGATSSGWNGSVVGCRWRTNN